MAGLRDRRVLVTGAAGFIGSHLTRRLVAEGTEVHALTDEVSSVYPARLLDLRGKIMLHEGNITDRTAMEAVAKRLRPSVVFHLAAYTHVGKSWYRVDECIQTNVQGTVNLLLALEGTGYAMRGLELRLTTGRQTREFNYVEDIADGFVRLATTPGIEGELFNIGGGDEVSIHDVVVQIIDLLGNPIEPKFGALEHRPNEIWRMYRDSSKARDRLGWTPDHTLRQGLEKTIEWYRSELSRNGSSYEP